MKKYVQPTKPFLKDLSQRTQFQFEIIKKFNKGLTYTKLKETVATMGPVNDTTVETYIDNVFVDLMMGNMEARCAVRVIRDYLISISGDK